MTTLEHFAPLINSAFIAHTQAGPVKLILTEAEEQPRNGLPTRFRTPLSLIFSGPGTLILNQDTYSIEHPALGINEWFLAPVIGKDTPLPPEASHSSEQSAHPQHYQIIFN